MMIIWSNIAHHTDHYIYHDNVYNNDHCDCDTKDASELLDEKLIILSFENHIWAKIPSVTDASAPRFHQCSPNYKYQQLLSFMAV